MNDRDDNHWGETEIPSEAELSRRLEDIELTPEEHLRIKNIVHGERFAELVRHDRRYLVVGAGGDSEAAHRRLIVVNLLDGRATPPSIAMRLEDFGLTTNEMRLWARVFDILCGTVTHIVGVIEDLNGGYVWELGLMFAPTYRDKGWVLKRRYEEESEERKRYDNAMGASHVALLLTGPRAQEWSDEDELRDAVREIP